MYAIRSYYVWCGNNEIDYYFIKLYNKAINPKFDKISREVLPTAIWEFDPLRDYLPSSPYISDECFKYQQEGLNYDAMPQVHLWGIRGYYKTPFYTDQKAHFVSEIGYVITSYSIHYTKLYEPAMSIARPFKAACRSKATRP